jgi:hypothetical protein
LAGQLIEPAIVHERFLPFSARDRWCEVVNATL